MAVLLCKICGGDTKLAFGKTYGACSACGSVTTFPKIRDAERVNLFNEGNRLRMLHDDFDMAMYVFDKMLRKDAKDAEAHWCYLLCRYGIKYAKDPTIGKRIPLCRREGIDSLSRDANFREALKHSDYNTANIYIAEAKKILDINRAMNAAAKAGGVMVGGGGGIPLGAGAKSGAGFSIGAKMDAEPTPFVASGASADSLIEYGKACLKTDNYGGAEKNFNRAAKEYPNDYRAWWGLILCATAKLTKESGDWASLNSWFGRVKKSADAKTFATLEKAYAAYAKSAADADAVKDIETIGNIVKRGKAKAKQFRERQKGAQNEKTEREKNVNRLRCDYDDAIKKAADDSARYANRLGLSARRKKIAHIFLFSGILLGFFDGLISGFSLDLIDIVFFGVGLAVCLTIVITDNLSLSKTARELDSGYTDAAATIRNAVSKLKHMSAMSVHDKEMEENRFCEAMSRLDREIQFLSGEIVLAEERLVPCEKYLALGKNRIASMFFAWRCNSFGVKQEAENGDVIAKLRKAALQAEGLKG